MGGSKSMALKSRETGPELVFALIGAAGTDLDRVGNALRDALRDSAYRVDQTIRLSSILREFERWEALPDTPVDEQIEAHQKAGNELRQETELPDAMAILAVNAIRDQRGDADPPPPRAYIIRSLKRKEEVALLRDIYGSQLFVVAAFAPREERLRNLAASIAASRGSVRHEDFLERAKELIDVDEAEVGVAHGQNVREAFPDADVFIDASADGDVQEHIRRCVDIIMGAPFVTPTRDEFAMFQAQAAALRSADLGRQVGAAITNSRGDVLAVGTNEVPSPKGGLYWAGDDPDGRDFARDEIDQNRERLRTLEEVISALSAAELLKNNETGPEDVAREIAEQLEGSRLMNLGEFGRSVHAEMAALLDAARRGVSVDGGTLYSTTFPCHNCAKHIVASGVRSVRFVEPYPESLASTLHDDSIVVDPAAPAGGRVEFRTFVGVAPRRYMECFEMVRRKAAGAKVEWDRRTAEPRFPRGLSEPIYIKDELGVTETLRTRMVSAGLLPPAE